MLQMSFTNTAALPASCRAPPAPSAAVLTFTLFNHLIFFPPFLSSFERSAFHVSDWSRAANPAYPM